jgi:transcriptional regulator with XRE-family HTH domain
VNYKLPECEIEIGKRLRQFRDTLKIPRTVFALEIGISGERMASYEGGRVRVPYCVVKAIGERFGLNLRWLAEEKGRPADFIDLEPELKIMIPGRMPFSEAYPRFLKAELEGLQEFLDLPRAEYDFVRGRTPADDLRKKITWLVGASGARVPRHLLGAFLEEMISAVRAFENRHASEIETFTKSAKDRAEESLQLHDDTAEMVAVLRTYRDQPSLPKKKELTTVPLKGNVRGMKSSLKVLLDRVERASAPRGKKAMLARFLKVTPPRISEWIHGVKKPGGEVTLRLAEWVTAEEAKQKESPGDATSGAKGKTRSRNPQNEHSEKTSPRKR